MLQMALDAGLGGKGSQGYGCVEKVGCEKGVKNQLYQMALY